MATYDIATIRAALLTLLQTSTKVAFFYDYRNPTIEGYPAIIFDVTNEEGSMLDSINNLRVITFTLWVVTEVKVAGQEAAKDILDAAVKEVINILELKANAELGGTVDWTMPVIGKREEVQSPEGLVMFQEIILKCNIASFIG
jgi:hypothetical protein